MTRITPMAVDSESATAPVLVAAGPPAGTAGSDTAGKGIAVGPDEAATEAGADTAGEASGGSSNSRPR